TDKTKITRKPSKTGKHEHGNQKSQEKPRIQSKSQQVVNPQSTLVKQVKMENSSDQEQDGKDKSVKSSSLIGLLMPRGLKEAQEMMIFALDHSHNKHKGHIKDCQLGNPCEL
ncbi:hypothetical protein Tco_0039236, partial [Tanacetum coccineum]